MIFATVGTHEDPFDRLLVELDRLRESGELKEEVVIQSGYCRYQPRFCRAEKLMPFDAIQAHMAEARAVITAGGPATILQVMSHGKVPIIVPRQHRFGEHVDDHQLRFARRMADRAVVIEDIAQLGPALRQAPRTMALPPPGERPADRFAHRLDALCRDLLAERAKKRR